MPAMLKRLRRWRRRLLSREGAEDACLLLLFLVLLWAQWVVGWHVWRWVILEMLGRCL